MIPIPIGCHKEFFFWGGRGGGGFVGLLCSTMSPLDMLGNLVFTVPWRLRRKVMPCKVLAPNKKKKKREKMSLFPSGNIS